MTSIPSPVETPDATMPGDPPSPCTMSLDAQLSAIDPCFAATEANPDDRGSQQLCVYACGADQMFANLTVKIGVLNEPFNEDVLETMKGPDARDFPTEGNEIAAYYLPASKMLQLQLSDRFLQITLMMMDKDNKMVDRSEEMLALAREIVRQWK